MARSVVFWRSLQPSAMEWSREKMMELIDLYKGKHILWNPVDPHHFNPLKKNDVREEIARDTGRSVKNCKKEDGISSLCLKKRET